MLIKHVMYLLILLASNLKHFVLIQETLSLRLTRSFQSGNNKFGEETLYPNRECTCHAVHQGSMKSHSMLGGFRGSRPKFFRCSKLLVIV